MIRIVVAMMAAGLAAGCDTPNFKTSRFDFGTTKTLAATGNLRFVMERERTLPYGTSHVVCSEPSPDYAVESGTDAKLTVKSTLPTSPISEFDPSVKTTEVVKELSGRSKGVLALRDGLFAACQAYANGLIGKDAYSVILSQYGLVLTALMRDDTYQGNISARGSPSSTPAGSAFSAVLVACINNWDPTRTTGPTLLANELLTKPICNRALRVAASGSLK